MPLLVNSVMIRSKIEEPEGWRASEQPLTCLSYRGLAARDHVLGAAHGPHAMLEICDRCFSLHIRH